MSDAPALKAASIGVAMGRTGTEVTKEAADIIVTDGNFASIVSAIEEGRWVYENVAKTLGYLLVGNAGELMVMFAAGLAGWPIPLLPIQLLWINLVTDGLPALALATDAMDPAILQRPPRRPDAEVMDRPFLRRTMFRGLLTAAVALTAFSWEYYSDAGGAKARNAAFFVLVLEELLRSFSARSDTKTVFELGLFSNVRLIGIVMVSLFLQFLLHTVPFLQSAFGTQPASLLEYSVWIALAAAPLTVIEAGKLLRRGRPAVAP
jgi:P-type Ca2+ transporter type 2C